MMMLMLAPVPRWLPALISSSFFGRHQPKKWSRRRGAGAERKKETAPFSLSSLSFSEPAQHIDISATAAAAAVALNAYIDCNRVYYPLCVQGGGEYCCARAPVCVMQELPA